MIKKIKRYGSTNVITFSNEEIEGMKKKVGDFLVIEIKEDINLNEKEVNKK